MFLAINTSTPQFSIALLFDNGALLSEFSMSAESKNFRGFMPAIDYLFATPGVHAADLSAVIVARGPGSFTGLRVGLSTAKGFCQGLGIPVIGVSSLEAMANQAAFTTLPVCPILDSRKGEVFAALFRWSEEGGLFRLTEDAGLKIGDLSSLIVEKTLFLGNDFSAQAPVISEVLGSKAVLAPAFLWNLRASSLGPAGLKRFRNQDLDDLRDLVPAYMRPPDIRPKPFPLLSEQQSDLRSPADMERR